jgi:hypothetical protein
MANANMSKALVGGKLCAPEHTGQRGSCPKCGYEVRAHCGKPRWYWQHVELSPICHAEDLQRVGLTYEQWLAERPKRR